MMNTPESVVGVILAGGLARRMGGGDKCLLPLVGKTLLQRTIDRAQPQVGQLLLNANGNSLRFARTRLPVIADAYPNNPGPLAGIHAALQWMHDKAPQTEWLVSFASDTPFFPTDLVARLVSAAKEQQAAIAVARTSRGLQPVFALWHRSLRDTMDITLQQEHRPRLQDWIQQQSWVAVDFTADSYDPFFNINAPQDLYAAEEMVNRM